jgi:hypothetical protein
LGARHWRSFAGQDYFDSRGTFVSAVWCAPLVVLLTAMLAGFLYRSALLLVKLKRAELRRRFGKQAAAEPAPALPSAVRSRKRRAAA